MNSNRQFQCGPDLIGSQDRRLQPDAQAQAGTVPQRQAYRTGLQPELSGDFGFLGGKGRIFAPRAFRSSRMP
jgi:hypothetical protein